MGEAVPMPMNDAAAVKLLRAIAKDSERVFYTEHARVRMRQRKVTPVQILECLEKGIISESVFLDQHGNWKLTVSRRVAGKELRALATVYASFDEILPIASGADGLEVLVLQFPRDAV